MGKLSFSNQDSSNILVQLQLDEGLNLKYISDCPKEKHFPLAFKRWHSLIYVAVEPQSSYLRRVPSICLRNHFFAL